MVAPRNVGVHPIRDERLPAVERERRIHFVVIVRPDDRGDGGLRRRGDGRSGPRRSRIGIPTGNELRRLLGLVGETIERQNVVGADVVTILRIRSQPVRIVDTFGLAEIEDLLARDNFADVLVSEADEGFLVGLETHVFVNLLEVEGRG